MESDQPLTRLLLAAIAVSAIASGVWLYNYSQSNLRSQFLPSEGEMDVPAKSAALAGDLADEVGNGEQSETVLAKESEASPVKDGWRVLEPEDCIDAREHVQHKQNENSGWRIAAASLRGKSHAHSGKWREDAFAVSHSGGCQIIAVSDGAGSAAFSRIGSEIASRVSVATLTDFFSSQPQPLSTEVLAQGLRSALEQAFAELSKEAGYRQIPLREMACTLLLLVCQLPVDGGHGRIGRVQIGDGAIFLEIGGVTEAFDAGDHGAAAGETTFVTSRSPEHWVDRITIQDLHAPLQLGLVATDGITDDFYPFDRYAQRLVQGIRSGVLEQDHRPWAEALTETISYERRGSFDDRTLVMVAPVPEG